MLIANRRPVVARLLDLGDRALRLLGLDRGRTLTPESLKAEAAAASRLSDFGSPDFEQGLAIYCRSAEQDAGLDYVGREIVRRVLKRVLSNRLLLVEYCKHRPQESPLEPPVIVLGLPRSGTTFLQRLLAQAPAAYGPPAWQIWRPLPRTFGEDRRREITIAALKGMRQLAPQLDLKHYQDVDEPEECYHLLDPSFRAPGLAMLCNANGYCDWAMAQDMGPAYSMYREYLQILQQSAPGRRLTLKTPLHTPYMEQILAEIPDARFVQTHRDPVEAAGSMASLFHSMYGLTSPRVDPLQCGQLSLMLLGWLASGCMEQRGRSDLPVVDVRYSDLRSDPVGTVRLVHDELGLEWTPETERAVVEGAARRPQHKQGKHSYDLADFGLEPQQVSATLRDYTEAFLG